MHLVKVTARCWGWEELLPFLCTVEDCPLPSLLCEFLFREFPDSARPKHISLVPLWHVTAPETGGNTALKLWHFLVFMSRDLMDLLCLTRSPTVAKGTRGDSEGTFRDTVLMSFEGGGYNGARGLSPHSLN